METNSSENKSFKKLTFGAGARDSVPIAAGYFAVSFSFGILASKAGLSAMEAGLMSLTNVTSAGQFAGVSLYAAGATIVELICAMIIINLRYALLSMSLSQKLDKNMGIFKRLLVAFANTDEIFAVSISKAGNVNGKYMAGLEIFPIMFWTLGTICGALANNLLPGFVQSALGVALYAMFIAIVMPPARKERSIAICACIAMTMSVVFYYVPVLKNVSSGVSIILCTVIAAGVSAVLFPVKEDESK